MEKTLEVRLRLTETQPTYNKYFVVEAEGVIDFHYVRLTSSLFCNFGWFLNLKLQLLLTTQHILCVFTTTGLLVLAH